ncbi:mechanosensitive ion channel family protein [Limimaricola litoreus]|uniref:Mechanosensitive ion channel family protein n=1 Tax=Limimaricola litoreus TaxID=2955316 RepID=A0A9X2JQN1_9RHOB|nr:mechanosensitive ion channel family protein [Limimaricola litoreus]MCP1167791.1 mechanosensitive ion channel family protein [Limimaricola litoreus]
MMLIQNISDIGLGWLPAWAVILIDFGLAIALACLVHALVFAGLRRLTQGSDFFRRELVARIRGPARLALIFLFIAPAAAVAPLSPSDEQGLHHLVLVGTILLLGWIARVVLDVWAKIHLRRFALDSEDNLLARKHVTQTKIFLRVASVLITIVAIAAALMTFDEVRQYGVSLLASAGAAGIVAGLALQSVLKNIFAGIQLAMTQPIRIDDALIVEGEWGNVEEITSTYVVIRIWDWRRMIVPLSYFIEQPFQNWTRESSQLIGTVMIYLDHSAPVDRIRDKAREIAEASTLWDGGVFNLAVTDFRERVMEVRVLVSARNAPRAFDLRCEMREKLVAWIQAEIPHALPRTREELTIGTARGHEAEHPGLAAQRRA